MTDLISRLSAATGPDRGLDAEIALANGWTHHERSTREPPEFWRSPTGQICPRPPRYTESIDAALTLVPEDWHWTIFKNTDGDGGNFRAVACWQQGDSNATPAIALVIACLKAREDSKP